MSATAASPRGAGALIERLRPLDPHCAEAWLGAVTAATGAGRSLLCANGDPVEFAFTWPSGDMRVTCDPRPCGTPIERLTRARALCQRDLTQGARAHARRLAASISASGSWGGWVGSRLRAGRVVHKLYIELAGGVGRRPWPVAERLLRLGRFARTLRPVMAGFGGASSGVELYFRTRALHSQELAAVMSAAGIRGARRALESEVAFISGLAVSGGPLPGADQGVSIAFSDGGTARSVTWYTHADMLLGPPARVREAFSEGRRDPRLADGRLRRA